MASATLITRRRTRAGFAAVAATALVLAGCAADGDDTDAADAASGDATIEVEDNTGTQQVASPPTSVVALDNRTFQTLDEWGIELSAASRTLMPDTIGYADDESIPDVGNHREPNLEVIVAAEPDLVVSGQRFQQFNDEIAGLVPDATVLDLDPREGEDFADELRRQTEVLGEVFDRQAEAEELVAEFDAAIERVREAYNPEDSVMALNASGGDLGYLAPSVGRTLGPLFDIFDLTPSLEVDDASDDHMGDDISVEAIAESNPDLLLVMDRDAAVSSDEPDYESAAAVIEDSQALAGVTAVQEDRIVYMPADTYTNEGIQTYTEFFNTLADALDAQNDD